VHRDTRCLEAAVARRAFVRALRVDGTVDAAALQAEVTMGASNVPRPIGRGSPSEEQVDQ
jgi:predicted RNA-binding protein YlxR (DUF448 family)